MLYGAAQTCIMFKHACIDLPEGRSCAICPWNRAYFRSAQVYALGMLYVPCHMKLLVNLQCRHTPPPELAERSVVCSASSTVAHNIVQSGSHVAALRPCHNCMCQVSRNKEPTQCIRWQSLHHQKACCSQMSSLGSESALHNK